MAAPVLTAAAVIVCPHGGAVAVPAAASRVLIGGVPALTVGAMATVQNCVLPPGQPCATATWPAGATRVFADGKPVLIQSVTGLCLSAAGQPTGAPLVAAVQSRVMAR
jgi:hypothetical protein